MEQKNYEECVNTCTEAIEVGRRVFADYKLISRYARVMARHCA
jgi:predicted kinase